MSAFDGYPHEVNDVTREWVAGIERFDGADHVIDEAMRQTRSLSTGTARRVLSGEWLGAPLHPVLTDLPIGFWTSAWCLDIVGGRGSRRAAQRLVALGVLSVPAAAAAGISDWHSIDDRGTRRVGALHGALNVGATLVYLASWRARRSGHHGRGVAWGWVGATLATAAGHLGGHLAFGAPADGEGHEQAHAGHVEHDGPELVAEEPEPVMSEHRQWGDTAYGSSIG